MNSKKQQYYYDYSSTVPTNSTTTNTDTPTTPEPEPVAQPVATPAPIPVTPTPVTSPENTSPSQDVLNQPGSTPPSDDFNFEDPEVKKSNFLPLVLGVIAVLVIIGLIWAILPKDYQACSQFPGSETSDQSCKTFYGKTYSSSDSQSNSSDESNQDQSNDNNQPSQDEGSKDSSNSNPDNQPIPSPIVPGNGTPDSNSNISANTNTQNTANDTNKGGQPLPTATPKPTSAPTTDLKGGGTIQTFSPPIDWIKHNYPTQKFVIYMPKNYHPGSATRNLDTSITNISTTKDNYNHNPAITIQIQPNWNGLESIKNNSISFMIDENTGVIKDESDTNITRYYFVRNDQVWIYTCNHHGNADLKSDCDKILKSIQFT